MSKPDELADEPPKTVFVVTEGEYSDYHITSIWETRAEAEKHAPAATEWHAVEIEEWVLNQQEERTVTQWRARLDWKTGKISVEDKPFESPEIKPAHVSSYNETDWWGFGYGLSPELARKSLADALAKAKAEREGL